MKKANCIEVKGLTEQRRKEWDVDVGRGGVRLKNKYNRKKSSVAKCRHVQESGKNKNNK